MNYPGQTNKSWNKTRTHRFSKILACGAPVMATQVHQACRRCYWSFSIAYRPTWLLSSGFPHLICLGVIMWIQKYRRFILELWANQCLVYSFIHVSMFQCQIAPKKAHCLNCLRRDFRSMLTPLQVVCNSNFKVLADGPGNFDFLC